METIETGPLERDFDKFMQLLRAVQDEAREDGHWKLASISLEAGHIDPLAVLESIYEAGERHACIELPQAGEAAAGAEVAVAAEFAGADRFTRARAWLDEVFSHTWAVGQLDLPGAGPRAFCGFTFEDDAAGGPFAAAGLFVPRWQVTVRDGACVATANLRIEPEGDLEAEARRVLAAHEKFSHFDYDSGPAAAVQGSLHTAGSAPGDGSYAARVRRALEVIRAGTCSKVVVARQVVFERRDADGARMAQRPLPMLTRLRERYPACRIYSFANGRGQSFIGATPERLVTLRNGELLTEAIAGTAPRGPTAGEDAALAAALLDDDKNRREHAAVSDFIASRLAGLGLDVPDRARPRLLRLANVQHLVTPFAMPAPEGLHLFDVAAALFPTPAVAGMPQDVARHALADIEDAPRGLYAGLVGWVDARGGGELAVALRCALVDGPRATLYAGAGIVEGSDPAAESAETVAKMAALREAL